MRSLRGLFGEAAPRAEALRAARRSHGSATVPVLLALLLLLLVVATVYAFAAHLFGAPPPITAIGAEVDHQYNLTLWATGIVFVLAQIGLAWAIFRYRDRGQRAHFTHGSTVLEILWTSVTILVFLGLGFLGNRAWAAVRFTAAAPNAIQIEATESQFVFNFRYPGPDGKFGKIDPAQISPATGNPVGIDANDPAGKDDIVTPTLTVPVNHPIELLLRSQDMVHNFFVRELRLQQDAVPGMVIPLHFMPNRIGQYEIVCTQLCGLGHNKMHSYLYVVSESDYESFLRKKAAGQ